MNKFSDDRIIYEIEAATNIVDIVGASVQLTRKGNRYWGLCPFHDEKTPSFTVNPEKNMFYCFGCHQGGNIFSFLMKYENISFYEALQKLALIAGIELPQKPLSDKQKKQKNLYETNKVAADYFTKYLYKPEGQAAFDYVMKRGINKEITDGFELGFAPDGWQNLLEHMTLNGFSVEELTELGLVKRNDDKSRYYDLFRNRLMFPIRDVNGRIIGFGGRIIGDGSPKYLNSQETSIYSKRFQLYGLYQAREAIRSSNSAYIVEGYMDCLKMHQIGINNTVASLGTSFTPGQAALLHRYTDEATIMYDGDEAGQRETLKAIDIITAEGIKASVIQLPVGFDPDNLVEFYNKKDFLQFIQNNKMSHIQFKLNYVVNREKIEVLADKLKVIQTLKPDLITIKSPIELENQIRLLANQLQIEANLIAREINNEGINKKKPLSGNKTQKNRDNIEYGNYSLEEKILAAVIVNEGVFKKITEKIGFNFFQEAECKTIFDNFVTIEQKFSLTWFELNNAFIGLGLEAKLAKLSYLINDDIEISEIEIEKYINERIKKTKNDKWQSIHREINALKNNGRFSNILEFIVRLDTFLTQEGGTK